MKVVHTKQKRRIWTIVLETRAEVTKFRHAFNCRNSLHTCNEFDVKNDKFQAQVSTLLYKVDM